MNRSRTESVFKAVSRTRCSGFGDRRIGLMNAAMLFEWFLVVLIISGTYVSLSMSHLIADADVATDGASSPRPIMRLALAATGHQLWGQLGVAEINSVDLRTGNTRSRVEEIGHVITNWAVSHDGNTVLVTNDQVELTVERDHELLVSERMPRGSRTLAALSSNGNSVVCICNGTHARHWDLSRDEAHTTEFEIGGDALRLAVDSRGEQIVISGRDAELKLYDPRSGECLGTIPVCGSPSLEPVFSEDGRSIVMAHQGTIGRYDVEDGRCLWMLKLSESNSITSISLSPNEKWLAAADSVGGDLIVVDNHRGLIERRYPTRQKIRKHVFTPSSDAIFSGYPDGRVGLFNLTTGKETIQPFPM